jgi:DNA invertase Pin-like site-specific DNA recombinase
MRHIQTYFRLVVNVHRLSDGDVARYGVSGSRRTADPGQGVRTEKVGDERKEGPLKANEVLDAVKRYVSESGDNERQTAIKLGVSRVTLYRWLADKVQPHKRRLAQVAGLLKRIGYI